MINDLKSDYVSRNSFYEATITLIVKPKISHTKKKITGWYHWWTQQFSSVQSLSHVQLFASPWTAAHQPSLSITISQSLIKLMSIELVKPSNHLILCYPLLLPPSIFPASGSFPMSQLFVSDGQCTGVSASASVLPMNIQDWFALGWTFGSPCSPRDSWVFSNTTVQKHQFSSAQLSL